MSDDTTETPSENSEKKFVDDFSSEDNKETAELPRETDAVKPKTPGPAGEEDKVELILKPVADAPIMKQKKWVVPASRTVGWINSFVRKYLKLTPEDSLFLYVNQSFAPVPDHTVRSLFDCFGSDGKLVLHYSRSQAWG